MFKLINLSKRSVWYAIAAVVLILLIANIPVDQHNTITRGIDRFEDHRPLFGDRTQAQDIRISRGLEGIGAILVNLTHTKNLTDIPVTVSNPQTGEILRQAVIPGTSIRDDEFTSVTFAKPLKITNQVVRITLSDPQATSANALGVRFNPNDVYPGSTRLEKGQPEAGDLSLTLLEKVPIWQYIQTAIIQNPDRAWLIGGAFVISLLLAAAVWVTNRRVQIAVLLLLAVAAGAWRLTIIPQFKGVSGGDPYNYLFITQNIARGVNPFHNTKRLPGFPLLLLPAYLTSIDDQNWMRGISAVSAAVIVLVLPHLARQLRLPWSAQLLSAVLIAVYKNFWEVSLRPEPYTFYALLVLLALWLFYQLDRWPKQLALGLVLGYAAMTRQEGFVLAATIGVLTLWHWRKLWWRGYLTIFGPALLIVLPFFLNNFFVYGNPIYSQYFEGDRLQIVDSWPAFVDNWGATWGVIGSTWKLSWDQETRIEWGTPLFLYTIVLVVAWNIFKRFSSRVPSRVSYLLYVIPAVIGLLLLGWTIWQSATFPANVADTVMYVAAGWMVGSVLSFPFIVGWFSLPILAVFITQGLVALWFHPFSKHFQQIYPLLALMMATTLILPPHTTTIRTRVMSTWWYVGLLIPLAIIIIRLGVAWPTTLDKDNENTALDSVVYRAVRDARHYPGPYGVNQAYLPARLYFDETGQYFAGDEPHVVADETAWLKQFNIHTLVVTNNNPSFKTMPSGWQVVAHHKSAGKDDMIYESWVYILQ